MRIAHVMHGWPAEAMGGTGLYVESLAGALADLGHEVAIVHPSSTPQPVRQVRNKLRVHALVVPRPRRWRDTWDGDVASWTAWCKEWRPDVVHFHHLSGLPLGLIAATPSRRVLTLHDYAIPCARGQLVTADLRPCTGPSAEACTHCMGPALSGGPIRAAAGRALQHFPAVYRWTRAKLTRAADAPHVDAARLPPPTRRCWPPTSCSSSHHLAERMSAFSRANIGHTALPLVQTITPSPLPEAGPVRFLYASSIIPTKGPDRLLRAFRALRADARLTIAGHSPAFPTHPKFADELKAEAASDERITWLGPVPPQKMSALLRQHDVLVLLHLAREQPIDRSGGDARGAQRDRERRAPPSLLHMEPSSRRIRPHPGPRGGHPSRADRHTPAAWPSAHAHAEDLLEPTHPTGTHLECATLSHLPGTSSEA